MEQNNDQSRSPSPDGGQAPDNTPVLCSVREVLQSLEFAEILRQAQRGFPGHEIDQIVRHYGQLGEGNNVHAGSSREYRELMRLRYIRRYVLFTYSELPEGYEFQHGLPGGQTRPVVLLTPPSHIAEQQDDGTWRRSVRTPGVHGPAPYTEAWYQNYLRENNLPIWFLCLEHLLLSHVTDEADSLWLSDDENRPDFEGMKLTASANYLETRYPRPPDFPVVHQIETKDFYAYDLSKDDICRLARRFPAIVANANMGKYRIFIKYDYRLVIRHSEGPGEATAIAGEGYVHSKGLDWLPDNPTPQFPSYLTAYQGSPRSTRSTGGRIATARRIDMAEQARIAGGFIDINPNGVGDWRWLDPHVDEERARDLGFQTPSDVAVARQNRLLAHGIGQYEGPMVVWEPEREYFNPTEQPDGPGRWQYFTVGDGSSEDLAWTNFGNQPGFEGIPHPSAHDIWLRRQEYAATGETDLTEGINLVWVPGETDPEEDAGDDQTQQPPPTGDEEDDSTAQIDSSVQDPVSGLYHDPTNGGENDQTGRAGEAWYQTQIIGGKKYTMDRSRAHANDIQPHKSWFVTKDGQWKQWKEYSKLDWTNKVKVEGMNKWREQCISRTGEWPQKRQRSRIDYTKEEKEWLFEYVKESKGGTPSSGGKELAKLFNQQFKGGRAQSGVQAVYDRLRSEYKRNNGVMDDPVPRGKWERPKKDSATKTKGQEKEKDAEDPAEKDPKNGDEDGDVDDGDYAE